MNKQQRSEIYRMRCEGNSYRMIADALGISENTIKSYCRRNNLGAGVAAAGADINQAYCALCGKVVVRAPGAKARRFCSDKCRIAWWNAHSEELNQKSAREYICRTCGKVFKSYGKRERKYCSRACYGRSKAVRP